MPDMEATANRLREKREKITLAKKRKEVKKILQSGPAVRALQKLNKTSQPPSPSVDGPSFVSSPEPTSPNSPSRLKRLLGSSGKRRFDECAEDLPSSKRRKMQTLLEVSLKKHEEDHENELESLQLQLGEIHEKKEQLEEYQRKLLKVNEDLEKQDFLSHKEKLAFENDMNKLEIEKETLADALEASLGEMENFQRAGLSFRENGKVVHFEKLSTKHLNFELKSWVKIVLIGLREQNLSARGSIAAFELILEGANITVLDKLPHRSYIARLFSSGYMIRLNNIIFALELFINDVKNAALMFDGHGKNEKKKL